MPQSNFTPSRPSEPLSNLAWTFAIKRLSLIFLPTILALVIPPALFVVLTLLDNVSRGYGLSCIAVSSVVMVVTRAQIKKTAPSQKQQQEALQFVGRLYAPLLLSCLLVCRFVSHQASASRKNYHFHLASIAFGCRLAAGLFFLSVLIGLRHMGFFGIAQCSIFPLPNNPFEKIFYTLSSFNRILDQILAQDDPNTATAINHNHTTETAHSPRKQGAKRYRQPTLGKSIVQFIIHGFFGALFAQSVVVPTLVEYDSSQVIITHMLSSCTLMSCCTFLTTYFTTAEYGYNFKYHELSPKLSTSMMMNTPAIGAVLWRKIHRSGVIFYWLVMPILSLVGVTWVYGHGDGETIGVAGCVVALSVVYLTTLIMVVYLLLVDIILRALLLQPGLNVDNFVARNMDFSSMDIDSGAGSAFSVEDVIMESIVGGFGVELLEYLISPRLTVGKDGNFSRPSDSKKRAFSIGEIQVVGNYDLEQEEMDRNNAITSILAQIVAKGDVCGYRSFENDLLTLAILESMGGESKLKSASESGRKYPFGLSHRHYWNLHRRLAKTDPTKGQYAQPPIVPVLRAICAYIGAIGTGIVIGTSSSTPTAATTTLSIPPCTAVAATYSIRASCRLVVMNMVVYDSTITSSTSTSARPRKRYNRISLMLPVVLESIYSLRCGILDYARHQYERNSAAVHAHVNANANANANRTTSVDKSQSQKTHSTTTHGFGFHMGARTIQDAGSFESYLAVKYPSLSHLLACCDDNASMVVKALREVDGTKDLESLTKTSAGCREWLNAMSM